MSNWLAASGVRQEKTTVQNPRDFNLEKIQLKHTATMESQRGKGDLLRRVGEKSGRSKGVVARKMVWTVSV